MNKVEAGSLMSKGSEHEHKAPAFSKRIFGWRRFIWWPFATLFIYFLSAGPIAMLDGRGVLSITNCEPVIAFYKPFGWAYDHTALHKPLGIYLHLCSSNQYNENGDRAGEETHAPTD
ncbi:hypothetical protein [Pedosphaera parvula]|uniref:Uncharacterized protein n=1 Tax=Pedosphaera parvula (strain Ellin514) TaxID=320771 RepID=B9XDG3_PEDPL|nr:hypothetical protein [Pedosphaera parvula]EEF62109.1 hypothetical protein Cflav_PD6384 [Pedosphaera parvula Ellin514]